MIKWVQYSSKTQFRGVLLDVGVTDEFGRTPLHNAILGKQARIVEILLNRGASVEEQDERGDTPLHTAVRVGDETVLQVSSPGFNMALAIQRSWFRIKYSLLGLTLRLKLTL